MGKFPFIEEIFIRKGITSIIGGKTKWAKKKNPRLEQKKKQSKSP